VLSCQGMQDLTRVDLASMLPATTVMVVTVAATTTNGRPLPPEELQKVLEACDMAIQLEEAKRKVGQRPRAG